MKPLVVEFTLSLHIASYPWVITVFNHVVVSKPDLNPQTNPERYP